jgi:hypothetical protein
MKTNIEKPFLVETKVCLREPFFIKENFNKTKINNTLLTPFKKIHTQVQNSYPISSFFDELPLKPLEVPSELIPNVVAST